MPDTTSNSVTTALLSAVIVQAEDCIKSYLAQRYDISSTSFQTSTSVPPLVRTTCERLSMGYAYQQLSRGSKDSMNRGKMFIDQAMDKLEDIVEFRIDLYNTTGSLITEKADGKFVPQSNTKDYHDTFDEDDPKNWKIDSDKSDDIQDEKA